MGYADKQTMKDFVKEVARYDKQRDKLIAIGFILFSLETSGEDTTGLDEALRGIDVKSKTCVNKQFLKLTDNPLAGRIVLSNERREVPIAYKVKGMKIISELRNLEGLVNSVKLNELISYVRDRFSEVGDLYVNCFGESTFEEMVSFVVEQVHERLDDVYSTLLVEKARPLERLCV